MKTLSDVDDVLNSERTSFVTSVVPNVASVSSDLYAWHEKFRCPSWKQSWGWGLMLGVARGPMQGGTMQLLEGCGVGVRLTRVDQQVSTSVHKVLPRDFGSVLILKS